MPYHNLEISEKVEVGAGQGRGGNTNGVSLECMRLAVPDRGSEGIANAGFTGSSPSGSLDPALATPTVLR